MDLTALCKGPCRPDQHGGPRKAIPGMALCEECETRCVEDLEYIAKNWGALEAQLSSPETTHGERVTGTPTTALPINTAVSDAKAEIQHTLSFWVHIILDQTNLTGPTPGAKPAAKWLALHHKHITRNTDHTLAASIAIDAHDMRATLRRNAYPTGARKFQPDIPCLEWIENEDGEINHCPGEYTIWITDRIDMLPDMTCSCDPTHRLAPHQWRRAGRAALTPGTLTQAVNKITRKAS